MKKESVKIGWADADITPKGTVELYGQYYQRIAKEIHSKLGLTVMAIESESGEQAIMISMDTVGFPFDFMEIARDRIKKAVPEISSGKIMINATHVHTAPALFPRDNRWKSPQGILTPEEYMEFLLSRMSEAVSTAWKNRDWGFISSVRGYAVVGHCRRAVFQGNTAEMYGCTSRDDFLGIEGGEDSTVEMLFTYDAERQPSGAVVNIACPAQVMEATYAVSSDFTGQLRTLLKKRFGKDFQTLCQISAAGDQSPRDLVRNANADFWNEKGVAILGERLFDAVVKAHGKIRAGELPEKVEIAHEVCSIKLPKRFPPYREVAAAEKELERLNNTMSLEEAFAAFTAEVRRSETFSDRPGPYDDKLHPFSLMKNAEAVIKRDSEKNEPYIDMELHIIRLGQSVFCTNVFELFLDHGLRIKARSKAGQTFVVQLCCGTEGYLPTEKAEMHGGYGALISSNIVGAEGGDKLVDETVRRINRLFKEL